MYESYLWNRRCGPADPVVRDLENKLACKSYSAVMRRRWARKLVGPAVLVLDAAAVLLLVLAEAVGGVASVPAAPEMTSTPVVSFEQEAAVEIDDASDVEEPTLDVAVGDDAGDDAAFAQK